MKYREDREKFVLHCGCLTLASVLFLFVLVVQSIQLKNAWSTLLAPPKFTVAT